MAHTVLSAQTVILADLDTGKTEFSFAQPDSASRLVPFDLASFETPLDGGTLHLEILRGSHEELRHASLEKQSTTGLLRIRFDDGRGEALDLAAEEYRWVDGQIPEAGRQGFVASSRD